jgi:hypothetical protein
MQTTSQPNRATRRGSQWCVAVGATPLLWLLTGCGGAIAGDWHMIKAIPSKEVFAIDDVHFDREGGFAATVTIEGKTAREEGTYEFNGFQLTMRPQAGGQRRYNAVLKGRTFEVIDDDRRVILKKGRRKEREKSEEK